MFKRSKNWFKALPGASKVGVIGVVVVALSAVGVVADSQTPNSTINTRPPAVRSAETQITNKVTYKTVTETSAIPFETTQQENNSLAKGTTKTISEGVNGERITTYKVTYTNGLETAREKITEVVAKAPVTKMVAIGTYVYVAPQPNCPNGTYVNAAGNTVCSPYQSSSAPAGATAECQDGTYSFSQSRRGTCSHHGGVATWL